MDKIFSARLDESIVNRISRLAKAMGISKKALVESAVSEFGDRQERKDGLDVFERTSGAWRRTEKTETTVARARRPFQDSIERRRR